MKIVKHKLKVYHGYLVVIISKDLNKVANKYNFPDASKYAAFTFEKCVDNVDSFYIVLDEKNIQYDIIAHEVVHLVNYIFDSHGCQLDSKNDEPQAYLTGYIFNKILKTIKKA
ncbi:hypothetical protein D0817_20170 [Flavobacterium cupreum]|uniref:Uncharacterized protein n=1 Tax=Flavobacterium cupreum TaxID=2133766 RepID=A0A434A2Q0_9FLAO|nr:hypothetical protein [Flavobacterium cupreum]RUT68678.1 hypothetical protein D0817_20170 [Flavobacterium cupreum]